MSRKAKREAADPDAPPWVVFRYGPRGEALGYFWGPGYEKEEMRGKPAVFGIYPKGKEPDREG